MRHSIVLVVHFFSRGICFILIWCGGWWNKNKWLLRSTHTMLLQCVRTRTVIMKVIWLSFFTQVIICIYNNINTTEEQKKKKRTVSKFCFIHLKQPKKLQFRKCMSGMKYGTQPVTFTLKLGIEHILSLSILCSSTAVCENCLTIMCVCVNVEHTTSSWLLLYDESSV